MNSTAVLVKAWPDSAPRRRVLLGAGTRWLRVAPGMRRADVRCRSGPGLGEAW